MERRPVTRRDRQIANVSNLDDGTGNAALVGFRGLSRQGKSLAPSDKGQIAGAVD
jgi:hypothetical protein